MEMLSVCVPALSGALGQPGISLLGAGRALKSFEDILLKAQPAD